MVTCCRAIIWPVLAEHICLSEGGSRSPSPSQYEDSTSDSDFESATSQCSMHDAEEAPTAIFEDSLELLKTHKEWRQVLSLYSIFMLLGGARCT